MKKAYLIVLNLNSTHYIQLAKAENGFALLAFETKEDAIKPFEGFKTKAMSTSYETHISGSMGILNLGPHIVEVPLEDPESLRKYLIKENPIYLKGGVFGAHIDLHGVEVKSEILELSVCNVAQAFINEVYEPKSTQK